MTSPIAAAKLVASISYESQDCSRCGGSGSMPYSVYGGACFKCNRKGVTMTRAGRTAHAKVQEWAAANLTVAASSLKVGDRIITTSGTATVTAVEVKLGKGNGQSRTGTEGTDTFSESWSLGVTTISVSRGYGESGPAHRDVRLAWTRESLTEAARLFGHLKGMTVTYVED